jgi:DNA-directed RNA polymerase subunit RPC12/RpoP
MLKSFNFQIQVTCPGCNSSHPVSSLLANEICVNCGKELIMNNLIQQTFDFGEVDRVKLMNGFLKSNINPRKSSDSIGSISEIKMNCWSHPASCEECKTPLDEPDILDSIANKKPIYCKKCNHPMPVRPADDEIKQFHPKAIGVINDSKGFDVNPDTTENKNQTIVFSCMTCGAGLKLDKHSERLMKCTYCDNENYLPDAIWNRLHPYKEPEKIYLILDLEESDMKETLDYFFDVKIFTNYILLGIRETYFSDFINSYFTSGNGVFLSDSVKCWWKNLLNSKYERVSADAEINTEIELANGIFKILFIEDVKNIFFSKFRNTYEKLNPELKEFIAGNILEIPDEIRDMLSKDANENVRLAMAKIKPPEKQITPSVKEEKKGFFGKLFG